MATHVPHTASADKAALSLVDNTLLPRPPGTPPTSPALRGSPASRRVIRNNRVKGNVIQDRSPTDEMNNRTPSPGDRVSQISPSRKSEDTIDGDRMKHFDLDKVSRDMYSPATSLPSPDSLPGSPSPHMDCISVKIVTDEKESLLDDNQCRTLLQEEPISSNKNFTQGIEGLAIAKSIDTRTPSPADHPYTPEDLRIQLPDDMDTSDEEIHRLTCRHGRARSDSESPDHSSPDLSPEDVIKLSELEAFREASHREVEMYLLRADIQSRSDRSDGITPEPSPSGDELWSSGIYTEEQLKTMPIKSKLAFVHSRGDTRMKIMHGSAMMSGRSTRPKDVTDQSDEYYHRVVPVSLPPQNTENAKQRQRYRRHRNRLNPKTNRLSNSLTRYTQYQNIWADIYDQEDLTEYSTLADLDPKGLPWLQGYTAPLVCPVPGEESGDDKHSEHSCDSIVKQSINPIIQSVLNEDAETLLDSLKEGAGYINEPIDEGGWTALHFAVRFSNLALCRILLEHNASIDSYDSVEHWSPLHVAAMTSDIAPEILKLLLEHAEGSKSVIETDNQGRSALHLCLLSVCEKLAERELDLLMEHSAVDDFHYFLLQAGDWSIRNTTGCKLAWEQDYGSYKNDQMRQSDGNHFDMQEFPASDSQHTLTGDVIKSDTEEDHMEFLGITYDASFPALIPVPSDISTDMSDDNADVKGHGYDPDKDSSSDNITKKPTVGLPLLLLQDTDSAEDATSQSSFPIYTIPEDDSVAMTSRFVTTTHTFRQGDEVSSSKPERELFEYESDESSIEDCVAVLEAYDLSPDENISVPEATCTGPALDVIMEKIKLLLASKLSVDANDHKGFSVLHYATWVDSMDIFKTLMTSITDLSQLLNDEQQTILHMAALSGNLDIIKFLIKAGSNLNQLDQYHNSPVDLFIMEHIRMKNELITPWLRNKETEPKHSQAECLRLLETFADHEAIVSNITSLDHLVQNIPIDKLEDLVTSKPTLLEFHRTNFQKQTLIHVASSRTYDGEQNGLLPMNIGFLIDNGISVHAADINGRTALHLACWQRNKILVKTLLTHGADTKAHDKFGQNCLHYTVMEMRQIIPNWYSFSAFQAALARSADPSHPEKLVQEQLDILELLLAHGANLHQEDSHGRTTIHRAVIDCDKSVVEYILAQGADLHGLDSNGISPSTYIVKLHRKDLFHLTYSQDKKAKHSSEKCKDLPPFRRIVIPAIEERQGDSEIDVLEQVRNMRGKVDKFTQKLLTTQGIGHVKFEDENANIRAEVFLLMQRLSTAIGNINELLSSSPNIVGSVREDTQVSQPNGFNYIFELLNLNDCFEFDGLENEMVQQSQVVSLKRKKNRFDDGISVKSFCDKNDILHGSSLGLLFSSAILTALSEPSLWEGLNFLWDDELELGSNFITFPSILQLRWMGSRHRDLLIDVDITPSIKIQNIEAQQLANLNRKKHRNQTNYFVPSGQTVLIKWEGDVGNDANLHTSFAEAEIHIMDNVSDLVKSGFRLSKIICNTGICQQIGSGVDCHLLKNVLFWLISPTGDLNKPLDTKWVCPIDDDMPVPQPLTDWMEIRWVAYHLFDRLESHLYSGYLASFFVPGYNLLSNTSKNLDSMIDLCMAAKALLSDP